MNYLDIFDTPTVTPPQEAQEAPTAPPRPDPEANPETPGETFQRAREHMAEARTMRALATPQWAASSLSTAYGIQWTSKIIIVDGIKKRVLEGEPSAAFWNAWRLSKEALRRAGFQVRPVSRTGRRTNWRVTNYNGSAQEIR